MARTSSNVERTLGMKRFAQLRAITGMSQKEFARHYGIPERNIQNWESRNQMPEYAFKMYAFKIYNDYAGTILSDEQLEEMVQNWDEPYNFDENRTE